MFLLEVVNKGLSILFSKEQKFKGGIINSLIWPLMKALQKLFYIISTFVIADISFIRVAVFIFSFSLFEFKK